jgi:hypothetical protein
MFCPFDRTELADDGDIFQPPKRRYELKLGRWIMSKMFVIVITHHRHKPSGKVPLSLYGE